MDFPFRLQHDRIDHDEAEYHEQKARAPLTKEMVEHGGIFVFDFCVDAVIVLDVLCIGFVLVGVHEEQVIVAEMVGSSEECRWLIDCSIYGVHE